MVQAEHSVEHAGNYVLRLYVTGTTPRSVRAIRNVLALCETYLKDRYELDIVDIYQDPVLARDEQIVAVPTLVRCSPLPCRRLVGDFCDRKKLSTSLGIEVNE